MKIIGYILIITLFLAGCKHTDKKLPIIGRPILAGQDTVHATVKPFSFVSQDSTQVTEKTFDNRLYVADFIFLSCTSICPVMTHEMEKVYDVYKTNPNVLFLSHTIDPENDTIPRLKEFANALGIDDHKWFFVTGNKDSIYSMAENSYYATAYPDKNTPGSYIHSGGLLLVDIHKHIRGVYDGTNPKETERLIADIKTLLNEQF